ncbi:hypothetical protein [Streptomyces sp. NPDC008240]|uniref:hypothetical protein n=1 Tax=Streptomyces sp. NPDC008240 TaxID=3364822 RepID=UPI0036F07DD6
MPDRYSAAGIKIVEFDEHVRRNPAMSFGVSRDHPGLATRVLCRVLAAGLRPAARPAPDHTPRITAEIHGDLAFSVTDDVPDALEGARTGQPRVLRGAARSGAPVRRRRSGARHADRRRGAAGRPRHPSGTRGDPPGGGTQEFRAARSGGYERLLHARPRVLRPPVR